VKNLTVKKRKNKGNKSVALAKDFAPAFGRVEAAGWIKRPNAEASGYLEAKQNTEADLLTSAKDDN
jgi:hypothetical protein